MFHDNLTERKKERYNNYINDNNDILRKEDKIGVLIIINNLPEIDKNDIKKNFIDKLEDNIKRFYFDNISDFPQLQKELDEITEKFSETNILVLHYSYGHKLSSRDNNLTLYYLKGNKTFIDKNCFYNILTKNKTKKSTILIFSNIIEKNSDLNVYYHIIRDEKSSDSYLTYDYCPPFNEENQLLTSDQKMTSTIVSA